MTENPIQEFNTPEEAIPAWQRHDWTAQEALFVQAYLRHGDCARAWVEAFRPEKDRDGDGFYDTRVNLALSRLEGNKLLLEPHIKDYVRHMREEIKARLLLTRDVVLEELTKLATSNMVDFLVIGQNGQPEGYDFSGLSREQYAAIQEMTIDTYMDGKGEDAQRVKQVKLKLAPKQAALDSLGKHFKLFTDVVEVSDITDAADVMTRRKREQRARRLAEQGETGDQTDETETEELENLGEYPGDEIQPEN